MKSLEKLHKKFEKIPKGKDLEKSKTTARIRFGLFDYKSSSHP